jgi:hypothetical protein
MSRKLLLLPLLLLASSVVLAEETTEAKPDTSVAGSSEDAATESAGSTDDKAEPQKKDGAKVISGMSVLGNQEAPKALVIVPWKSSEIGDSLGISTMLDDSRQPVDREVFLRELSYYRIRSETSP